MQVNNITQISEEYAIESNYIAGTLPRIYCKIDWFTVMFEDHTINDVLTFLKLSNFASEFSQNIFERCHGYDDYFVFHYEGISIEARKMYLYGSQEGDLFDLTIPQLRLDISGTGLDYLRSTGINVESYFRTVSNYPERFHLTRCDFAFDFINYMPDLCDKVIDHCLNHHLDSDRIAIYQMPSGYKYRVALGGQKTLYLGATTSERMLRIYDKRLQYIDHRTGIYVKDNPYDNPVSWIRVELQLRRKSAAKICLSDSDSISILKYIYEQYCFADTEHTTQNNRRPVEWWSAIFDWDRIPQIIQNFEEIEFVSMADRTIQNFYNRGIFSFVATYSILGHDQFFKMLNDFFIKLNDIKDPVSRKRLVSFLNKADACGIYVDGFSDGLYNANPFGSEPSLAFRMKGSDDV